MAADKATKKSKPPTLPEPSNMDSVRPLGWKERYGTYAQWIGALVACAALVLALWNRSAAHDEEDFKYRVDGRIDDRLKPVSTRLDEISERLAKAEGILETLLGISRLKQMAALEPREFAKALPLLQKIASEPLSSQSAPDQRTLQEIAFKLRVTPQTVPGYWPTVLQFIQFASSAMTPPTDVPAPGPPNITASGNRCIGAYGEAGGHCLTVSHRIILLDGGDIPGSRFYNCRVIFTQNPVGMRGVRFINCVFEMPVTSSPTPYLKDAARQLLASNLTSVSIPSP